MGSLQDKGYLKTFFPIRFKLCSYSPKGLYVQLRIMGIPQGVKLFRGLYECLPRTLRTPLNTPYLSVHSVFVRTFQTS